MAKDKPKEKFDGVVLKKSTATTATTSTIRQPPISVSEQVQPVTTGPMSTDPHRVKAEILQTKSHRIVSSREELKPVDEEESRRIVKKRRTSSGLPEEARIVACTPPGEVEELPVAHPKRSTTPEAEPDGNQWDDLDAEEADDPLMVSEDADEIFTHLKVIEVSELWAIPLLSLTLALPENDHA